MRAFAYASVVSISLLGSQVIAQEAIKIALIDSLSGGGASIGEAGLKSFAVKQANLNHQVFVVGEGYASIPNPESQAFESAQRQKCDFSVLYPRVVNVMRMPGTTYR